MIKFVRPMYPVKPSPGEAFSTVRLGPRWAREAPVGCYLQVVECGEPHEGSCTGEYDCRTAGPMMVIQSWQGPLGKVGDHLLSLNPDPDQRTLEGLQLALSKIYLDPLPSGAQPILDLEREVSALVLQP